MQASQTSYRSIVVIVLALSAYGSIYPLEFSLAAGDADTWRHFWTDIDTRASFGNILGNIVLFLPFGFFAILDERSQASYTTRVMAILFWGTLFALLLQLIQVYIPARDQALFDVVWNMIGIGLGIVLARGSAALTTRWLSSLHQPAAMASLVVAVLWLAAELVPLVPSLDFQLVKDSLKPLLLEPRFALLDSLAAAIGLCVLGQALARLRGERASLAWLLLAAVLVLAAKPFVVVVELDLSTVIGFGLGWAAWAVLLHVNERQRAAILLVGLVVIFTATGLEPFELARQSTPMGWIPFAEVLDGPMLINSRALVSNLFVYTAILWLVRLRGSSLVGASLLLAVWVTLIEIAQMFIVGRTPSITEPLWVFLVAATLARLTDAIKPATSTETQPQVPQPKLLANPAIIARLNEQQIDFLDKVAQQLGLDFQGAIQRVVDIVLHEYADSTLVARLRLPTLYQAGDPRQRLVEQTIELREEQLERIEALAAHAGMSASRTMRRTVRVFMEDIARDV